MSNNPLPVCSKPGCTNRARSRQSGLCGTHYAQQRKGDIRANEPVGRQSPAERGCKEQGCPNPHHANGYCSAHNSYYKRVDGGQKKGVRGQKGGLR